MNNYTIAITCLEKEKKKQIEGYQYIYNSPLEGEERQTAIGKVKHKLRRLTEAIELLQFLQKNV